jgi:hypothetical protein
MSGHRTLSAVSGATISSGPRPIGPSSVKHHDNHLITTSKDIKEALISHAWPARANLLSHLER